ncbi:protein [Lentinula edodes]|uniref:Protein n=1 Tax=Lentinula edodes TaxID=5353 RepID=A0A1Q3E9F8_LENED|nr:protein [Lentinula edodes]
MQASAFTDQVVCALGEESQTRPTRLERIVEELKTRQDQDEVLDPLTLLAHLVPSPDAGADALLEVIRERCSPKEVIVACEELLEALRGRVEEGKAEKEISLMCQVLRLVRLFTVITTPRASRRRKVSNMIHSFAPDLASVIRMTWLKGLSFASTTNPTNTSSSPSSSPPPPLSPLSSPAHYPTTSSHGSEVMQRLVGVYTRLGGRWDDSFVLWAHAVVMGLDQEHRHAPVIIAAIRGDMFLDEALAVLLVFFSSSHSHSPPPPPPSYSEPLLTLLPTLASAHPDPFIRLCAFRLLALVLRAVPGFIQVQVLVDLLSGDQQQQHHHHNNNNNNNNNPHSQMLRVAAVGLVKDLVLDALSIPGENNILASPAFVLSLAPVLFTPPELVLDPSFSMDTIPPNDSVLDPTSPNDTVPPNDTDEALEVELTRLGHVLALYYALEKTDVANRTGIRDPDNRANIERTLVAPIRNSDSERA